MQAFNQTDPSFAQFGQPGVLPHTQRIDFQPQQQQALWMSHQAAQGDAFRSTHTGYGSQVNVYPQAHASSSTPSPSRYGAGASSSASSVASTSGALYGALGDAGSGYVDIGRSSAQPHATNGFFQSVHQQHPQHQAQHHGSLVNAQNQALLYTNTSDIGACSQEQAHGPGHLSGQTGTRFDARGHQHSQNQNQQQLHVQDKTGMAGYYPAHSQAYQDAQQRGHPESFGQQHSESQLGSGMEYQNLGFHSLIRAGHGFGDEQLQQSSSSQQSTTTSAEWPPFDSAVPGTTEFDWRYASAFQYGTYNNNQFHNIDATLALSQQTGQQQNTFQRPSSPTVTQFNEWIDVGATAVDSQEGVTSSQQEPAVGRVNGRDASVGGDANHSNAAVAGSSQNSANRAGFYTPATSAGGSSAIEIQYANDHTNANAPDPNSFFAPAPLSTHTHQAFHQEARSNSSLSQGGANGELPRTNANLNVNVQHGQHLQQHDAAIDRGLNHVAGVTGPASAPATYASGAPASASTGSLSGNATNGLGHAGPAAVASDIIHQPPTQGHVVPSQARDLTRGLSASVVNTHIGPVQPQPQHPPSIQIQIRSQSSSPPGSGGHAHGQGHAFSHDGSATRIQPVSRQSLPDISSTSIASTSASGSGLGSSSESAGPSHASVAHQQGRSASGPSSRSRAYVVNNKTTHPLPRETDDKSLLAKQFAMGAAYQRVDLQFSRQLRGQEDEEDVKPDLTPSPTSPDTPLAPMTPQDRMFPSTSSIASSSSSRVNNNRNNSPPTPMETQLKRLRLLPTEQRNLHIRPDGHLTPLISGMREEAYDGRSYIPDDPLNPHIPPAPPGARSGEALADVAPHPLGITGQRYHMLMKPNEPTPQQERENNGGEGVLFAEGGPRLTTDKKPPPKMACLFCRNRKIACGPGPMIGGPEDKTCNQCHRRGIPCEFPTESRRGMRTRRPPRRRGRAASEVEAEDEDGETSGASGSGTHHDVTDDIDDDVDAPFDEAAGPGPAGHRQADLQRQQDAYGRHWNGALEPELDPTLDPALLSGGHQQQNANHHFEYQQQQGLGGNGMPTLPSPTGYGNGSGLQFQPTFALPGQSAMAPPPLPFNNTRELSPVHRRQRQRQTNARMNPMDRSGRH